MNVRSLQTTVLVRHYRPEDVALRADLLTDGAFQENLHNRGVRDERDVVTERELGIIRDSQWERRILTVERSDGTGGPLGFCWLTDIDWVAGRCELSIALLPRFRRGLGLVVHQAVTAYAFHELGMRLLVHQVLDHNTMLLSSGRARRLVTLVSEGDDVTGGQVRDALYWTETRAEFEAAHDAAARRRTEIRERLAAGRNP